MPAQSTVLIGPARSGKTDQLLSIYRAALSRRVPRCVLWLSPTARSAASIRERLLSAGLTACFAPGVTTFDRFAESILRASPALVKPINDLLRRHLILQVIDQAVAAGRLRYFGSIADTPGFVDLVGRFIREWKRMEIWPEQFRDVCLQQGEAAKDVELADLYTQYQQRLIDHNLYDAEGRFWTARGLLRQGQRRPWENLQLVVADGFTDFTRTQHEILQILSQRVEELVISLPGEAGQGRDDLFAKPRQTLSRLHYGLSDLTVRQVDRPPVAAWPAMAHLEQRLFDNPRDVPPTEDSAGIEVIAATGQYEEIARVGGHIKALLTGGDSRQGGSVPPGDIMVVFRSLESVAALVREVFSEQGIPFALDCGRRLDASPALASLLSFLRLDLEDWPLGRLLALLTNNYFRPDWPQWRQGEAAHAAVSVVRRLYFFSGRHTLFELLQRRLAYLESIHSTSNDSPANDDHQSPSTLAAECRLTIDLLNRLAAVLDALPQRATAGQWVEHLRALAMEIGFVAALDDQEQVTPDGFDDRAAWLRLTEALAVPDDVARLTVSEAPLMDRRGFVQLVCDSLRSAELRPASDESGRVRVLSAASARALSVPYLFIAGMSEKSFPPPDREDRAYSEAEYRRMAAAGLPLVLREERGHEEMLLFYEVATRATRRLTLSYAALDEKAEPLLPSPFLTDVGRLFVKHAAPPALDTGRLSPVPMHGELYSQRGHRLRAVADALAGDDGLLSRLTLYPGTRDVGSGILAGLTTIHARSKTDGFGAFEGMLNADVVAGRLAEQFGADRAWSPSALERYMNCPYRFFLSDVLRLQEPPEVEFEIDRRRRGSVLHKLLAVLHRGLTAEGLSPAAMDEENYLARCRDLLADCLSDRAGEGSLAAALTELDRRQLQQWVENYRRQFAQYGAGAHGFERPPTPTYFEVAFGLSDEIRHPDDPRDPLSTAEPLRLSLSERTVLISGMIDRIDLARRQGRTVFNVVDYKTGAAPPKKKVLAGEALQLALYAMAAESLLLAKQNAVPWEIGYWELKDRGFRSSVTLAGDEPGRVTTSDGWQQLKTDLTRKVHGLVRGIHAAEFPVFSADENCTAHCAYSTVCRIGQVRALEKTWQPPQPN